LTPLRVRNFRLLFVGRTISFFGTNLVPIALAFAVLDLTGSATDTGLVFAARTLAQISTLLLGGVIADRLPRQLVMIGSDTANLAVQAVVGGLLVTHHAHLWQLVVLQLIGGAATAFHSPASTGLVPQTVPPELLRQANAYMGIARYSANVVGAAAGGALVATVGSGWAILLDSLTYLTSAALLAQMRLPATARSAAAPNFVRELREGWHAFTEHTWVWLLTLWISLYFLITYAPFFVLGPYVARLDYHGPRSWAFVVTGEAIGALAGAAAGLRLSPRRPMVTIGALFVVTGIQEALLAARAPIGIVGVAAGLAGFAFAYGTVVWDTTMQARIRPDRLSRVSAYNWMGAMAFLPAGYAIAGPVAMAIGVDTSLWIAAAWILVSTAVVLRVPSVRDVRRDEPPTAEAEAALA
jgi:predicted MFS family arabinose efflux permease